MRRARFGRGGRVAVATAMTIAAACALGGARAPAAASASEQLCGSRTGPAPATYRHVVVIMDENKSYGDILGRSSAPYLNRVAAACGLATNYRGVTHPSHPNYMAATGGIRTPLGYLDAPNIFRQVHRAGGSWRVYEEAMPHNCDRRSASPYKAGHNPGIAYASIRVGCRSWDVGWSRFKHDVATHHLPTYAFITPDQCHNMHASCRRGMNAIRAGDRWLSRVIPQIVATPGYRRGRTAIVITWDEGSNGQRPEQRGENCLALVHLHDRSCHVPTFILSEYLAPGTRSNRLFSHYSLLQTTERLLGLERFLGHAADPTTSGMRAAFGF
jgi:phosphatidylinositol-3-phosphatase